MRIPKKGSSKTTFTLVPHENSEELLSKYFDGYIYGLSSIIGLEHISSQLLPIIDSVMVVDLMKLKIDFYPEGTGRPLDALMICDGSLFSYVSIKLAEFNMITTSNALANQFGQSELLLDKFDVSANVIIVLLSDERFEQNKSVLLRKMDNDVRRVFPMRIKDFCDRIQKSA